MTRVGSILACALLVMCVCVRVATAQTALACSADRPIVVPGGTIQLRTFGPPGKNDTTEWSVSRGGTAIQGSDLYWLVPDNVTPGQRLTAVVTRGGATCSVTVIAISEELSRNIPKATFLPLLPKDDPLPRYGLYTYVLLGAAPSATSRPAVVAALESYMGFAPFLESMLRAKKEKTDDFNLTTVPVLSRPKTITSTELLKEYDYRTAKHIMGIASVSGTGLYLLSSRSPLHVPSADKGQLVAVQNLSGIPPNVIDLWVREFLRQTSMEQRWDPPALRRSVLYLRTTIAVLAQGLSFSSPQSLSERIVIKGQ